MSVHWVIQGQGEYGWWKRSIKDCLFHTHFSAFEEAIDKDRDRITFQGHDPITASVTAPEGDVKLFTASTDQVEVFSIQENV